MLSVRGGGKIAQLVEIGLANASGTQLGVGTSVPEVSPPYPKEKQRTAAARAASMNNGRPDAAESTDCAIPCTFTYTYPRSEAVQAVVLAHENSPKLFPARLKVEYYKDGWLQAGSELSVTDPPFVTLTRFKLSFDGVGGNNANSVGNVKIYCS